MTYFDTFLNGYSSYFSYLKTELLQPHWGNYFWWLVAISLAVWLLEWLFPWRKNQPAAFRDDFWLDGFYMFFNFFLFSLVGYNAVSDVVVRGFQEFLALFGIKNLVAISVAGLPGWSQLLILFVVRDFIQWNIHRLLHRSTRLWEFHKVHHSVQQMGFAAHLRYHWMETVVYRSLEYLPLAMIGFGISDFLLVHLFTLTVGHLNHANIFLPLGRLQFLFNSPQMHIWHHAEHLPEDRIRRANGVNFGLTLSVWDWIFGTAWMPADRTGRDEKLGFPQVDSFPKTFFRQELWPFFRKK